MLDLNAEPKPIMNQTTPIIGKEFAEKVIPLIEQAKKSIDIVIFDWKWYPDQVGSAIQNFNNAIIMAARRNKRVRVITNSSFLIKILSQNKVQTKLWHSKKNLHAKLMIIDNKTAILGSHNYTMNAFTINYETSIITQGEEVVKRLASYFENLWW